jgi:hypothetical protein
MLSASKLRDLSDEEIKEVAGRKDIIELQRARGLENNLSSIP